MHFSSTASQLMLLGLAATSQASPVARRSSSGTVAKALYLIDNLSPNHVIALPVASNGTVGAGKSYETKGDGASLWGTDGPVEVDSLQSQDCVVRVNNVSISRIATLTTALTDACNRCSTL
ncbi:hypothetical protein MRB53_042280 [Persea americana]|nr:hypothetical protein MRB53_042280 [Persea americana]